MATTIQIDTQLTAAAAGFIRRFTRFATGPEAGFQMRVTPGGCSGYATAFDLVTTPKEGDVVWETEGLRIYLDAASSKLLEGATVDFVETIAQTGFAIKKAGEAAASCDSSPNMVTLASLTRH